MADPEGPVLRVAYEGSAYAVSRFQARGFRVFSFASIRRIERARMQNAANSVAVVQDLVSYYYP